MEAAAAAAAGRRRRRVAEVMDAVSPGGEGGDGGGGLDRISDLPDGVIGEIICRLPTKDGARTQVLASRWRHLWRYAPLNLALRAGVRVLSVHSGSVGEDGGLADVVSRVLATHPGPGLRFVVPENCGAADRLATIDAWLVSPALDRLEELDLFYGLHSSPLPPVPASFSRFVPTLRVATIGHCLLPDAAVQGFRLPHLKQLGLERVQISESSIHRMIAASPALECLLIKFSFGFCRLRIKSLTLRSIGVRVGPPRSISEIQLRELIIENAPCLQMLLGLDRPDVQHISVLSAPKLETLGFISGETCYRPSDFKFEFGSIVIQELQVDKLTTVLRTIKVLALQRHTLNLDRVVELMRCFPCLEKLYIQSNSRREKNLWRSKHRNLIGHPGIRLKTVVLENYQGTKSDINFATFFLLNARMLELIVFQVLRGDYRFIAEQERKLELTNRASIGAKFYFTTHSCLRAVSQLKHVCDLDLTDPFISRC